MQEDSAVEGEGESLRWVMSARSRSSKLTPQYARQVACADVILLNKVDLVADAQISSTEALIRSVNPAAPVHRTVQGQVDLALVMGIAAYESQSLLKENPRLSHHIEHDQNDDSHDHSSSKHYELRGISSLQVQCPALTPSQLEKLDEWIRTVLWENRLPSGSAPKELRILRCKGLFTMQSGEQYVLQGVQNLYEISKMDLKDVTGVPEVGKLVLIGKGLDSSVRYSLESVFT